MFPDANSYDTYVEPFIGSGVVFLNTPKVKTEVINDLDKQIYLSFWGLQKYTPQEIAVMYQCIGKIKREDWNTIRDAKPKTKAGQFLRAYFLQKLDLINIRNNKIHNPLTEINEALVDLHERLKDVIITNEDFRAVIKKYDGTKTLMYFDPPYEDSSQYYKEGRHLTSQDIYDALSPLKSRWILSYSNTAGIKKLFSDKKRFTVKVIKTYRAIPFKRWKMAYDVLITNF